MVPSGAKTVSRNRRPGDEHSERKQNPHYIRVWEGVALRIRTGSLQSDPRDPKDATRGRNKVKLFNNFFQPFF